LIGDQAILFRQKFGDQYRYWDLGQEWRARIKLPFVYALWLIRPEVSDAKAIAERLRAKRDENLRNVDALITAEEKFDPVFCRAYFGDYLRFGFGEKEKNGLREFHSLCVGHGLLPKGQITLVTV
jgi:chorismate dehydratase